MVYGDIWLSDYLLPPLTQLDLPQHLRLRDKHKVILPALQLLHFRDAQRAELPGTCNYEHHTDVGRGEDNGESVVRGAE